MAMLIDKDSVIKTLRSIRVIQAMDITQEVYFTEGVDTAIAVVDVAHTVDAVEVVRCKDCAYWKRVDEHSGKCPFLIGEHQYAGDDHYCSCGDRREEDAVD